MVAEAQTVDILRFRQTDTQKTIKFTKKQGSSLEMNLKQTRVASARTKLIVMSGQPPPIKRARYHNLEILCSPRGTTYQCHKEFKASTLLKN